MPAARSRPGGALEVGSQHLDTHEVRSKTNFRNCRYFRYRVSPQRDRAPEHVASNQQQRDDVRRGYPPGRKSLSQ